MFCKKKGNISYVCKKKKKKKIEISKTSTFASCQYLLY